MGDYEPETKPKKGSPDLYVKHVLLEKCQCLFLVHQVVSLVVQSFGSHCDRMAFDLTVGGRGGGGGS